MGSGKRFNGSLQSDSNDEPLYNAYGDKEKSDHADVPGGDNGDIEDLSAEEMVDKIAAERSAPVDHETLYPEVFSPDYVDDISPQCRRAIESFSETDWLDITVAYKTHPKFGNDKLLAYLTKKLGLKERPHIVYEKKTGNTAGQYRIDTNTIVVFYSPEGLSGNIGDLVRVVSHEAWHAYQEQHANDNDNARSELYDANARHYVTSKEDAVTYRTQMLEREALWFGDHMKDRMEYFDNKNGKMNSLKASLKAIFGHSR